MARKRSRIQQRGQQASPPLPGFDADINSAAQSDQASVDFIDKQATSIKNLLRLKLEIYNQGKKEKSLQESLNKLGEKAAKEAKAYEDNLKEIESYTKKVVEAKRKGDASALASAKALLENYQENEKVLLRTGGGAFKAQQMQAAQRKKELQTERQLIKDINKERGLVSRMTDIFRTKEQKQRKIDIARAAAGGGANLPPPGGGGAGGAAGGAGGGGGGGKGGLMGAVAGAGLIGLLIAGVKAGIDKMTAPFKALGGLIKGNLTAPLAQASSLVSGGIGGGMGIGGGAISGAGASGISSLLGGFQDIISQIPIIGGLLGGMIGLLKTAIELTLGIDQGITNFARNLGISKDRAKGLREQYRAIADASGNIVVNDTRLMESQAELTKALGIRSEFSADILQNNIKLKEIAGLELETRKAIAQTSVITGRNAEKLTKSILAQSKAFEFETGVAFEFRDVLNQASKQAGVLGLIFANNDKKLTSMYMRTKAMGYELKQLDGMASSFLDFESSISKEMEAQVLTGKEMNLTAAREAALNNDLVTLAKEINTQVGSTQEFLGMNRIQQEAIAESVGMTRDSLADTLKQQDYYNKLGATNLKQAQEELKILKQKGYTEEQINKMIGEDAYNYITQTSTAERLTEMMNRIKNTFIQFVENSGILEFITNPQKIQGFVTGLITRLAGAVEMIGDIIAGILDAVGSVVGFFGGDSDKYKNLASSVRTGTAGFAGSMRGAAATVQGMNFGEAAPSVGNTVQQGVRQQSASTTGAGSSAATVGGGSGAAKGMSYVGDGRGVGDVYLDGQKVGAIVFNKQTQIPGLDKQ